MTTAQFEAREYPKRGGGYYRDLVMQLTRCIGIRRTDPNKSRSWYAIIDIETGVTFGCDVRTRKDAARVAGRLQSIIDEHEPLRGIGDAINNDECRRKMRAVCIENRNRPE